MHTNGISYDALSTLERNDLLNPDTGLTIYNKDNGQLEINLGSPSVPNWQPVVPVPPDTNTWDMTNVGFVDPSVPFGSGTLGDGNDPFRRVLDAVNAGASYIWLKPGTYTETITLQSNKTYYCPVGVKFTNGGLRAPSGTLSNCKWLGHAQFEGNFFAIYFITFCQFIDCVFDFDYIKTTGTASRDLYIWGHPSLTSTIVVNCNKIDSFGGNGNAIGILGLVEGAINIREKLIAYYSPYAFGFPGFAASEKLVINCPLTIMRNGGWAGTNTNKAVAYVLGATSVMDIEINSKLVVESGVTFGSVAGIITTWAGGSSGKIVWNGDKIAPSMPRGIYNTRPLTKVISRGDIYLPDGRLVETTNSGEVNIEQGNSVFSLSSLLGSTGTTYLKDFHIHAIGVGQNIFDLNTNSHNLYMDGVVAEGDGGAGLLVNTGGNSRRAGLKDTWSTQANDGAFTNLYASGFVQEANLISNKIL